MMIYLVESTYVFKVFFFVICTYKNRITGLGFVSNVNLGFLIEQSDQVVKIIRITWTFIEEKNE